MRAFWPRYHRAARRHPHRQNIKTRRYGLVKKQLQYKVKAENWLPRNGAVSDYISLNLYALCQRVQRLYPCEIARPRSLPLSPGCIIED